MSKKPYRPKAFQEAAVEFRKDCCEICGIEEGIKRNALSVHHKDGDWTNNDETNTQTLCQSCHQTLHWNEVKGGISGRLKKLDKLLRLYNQGVFINCITDGLGMPKKPSTP
jgi:hypothetical protein